MKELSRVLVVGASGFVGKVVCDYLYKQGFTVVAGVRELPQFEEPYMYLKIPHLETIREKETWLNLLSPVGTIDAIVYLAARVHMMDDTSEDPLKLYRAINRDAPFLLAQAAEQTSVKRFIYVSSVKAAGEESIFPLREDDDPVPVDVYGISKLEAEYKLTRDFHNSRLNITIIRPPLVYGPQVKGNLRSLSKIVDKRLPLPLGSIKNKRSLIYVKNLADAIYHTIESESTSGQIFYVSDGVDLSTSELVVAMAESKGQRHPIFTFPVWIMTFVAKFLARGDAINRLTKSLQVDISKAANLLSWRPPYNYHEGIKEMMISRAEEIPEITIRKNKLNYIQRNYLIIRYPLERILATLLALLLAPIFLLLAMLIRLDSKGPVIFHQKRIGRYGKAFKIKKFRTMRLDAPQVSTEDMVNLGIDYTTRLGKLLRRTSLDELPQIFNVIAGEMSFIGPRPSLLTQTKVIRLREACGVDVLLPGITGLSQISGRDDLTDEEKVETDKNYLINLGINLDIRILYLTIEAIFSSKGNK